MSVLRGKREHDSDTVKPTDLISAGPVLHCQTLAPCHLDLYMELGTRDVYVYIRFVSIIRLLVHREKSVCAACRPTAFSFTSLIISCFQARSAQAYIVFQASSHPLEAMAHGGLHFRSQRWVQVVHDQIPRR